MKFVILGLLVVLLIGFFVVVWKAAKEWRWYQIVAVIFTMLLAVILIFPTAGALKSRAAWHQIKEELEERADRIAEDQRVLKYGDPTDADSQGIVQLSQQLSEVGMEAGRRWRGLRVANRNANSITLVQPQQEEPVPGLEPAADAADAPPDQPLIPESSVVYGFAETMDPNLQKPIPTVYLGEFTVTASGPNQVTIQPLGSLGVVQPQMIQRAQSWSLYELLPLDGHMPFIAEGSKPSDDAYFGTVDEQLVRRVLGQGVDEQTIQNYLRDGSRATQDDPPISRWTKIEFLKKHTFNVDSPDQRGALDGGFFDSNGRAVDSRLQVGGDGNISFDVGEQVLVKEEAADQLIEEGIAKLVDRYYLRPMNDYRFVLRRIRLRLAELELRKQELATEEQVLDEAIAKTTNMLNKNQEAKLKLEQDLAQVQVEAKAINQYVSEVTDKVKQIKADMNRLHQENLQLEQQLEWYHLQIKARIDEVTQASSRSAAALASRQPFGVRLQPAP